MSSQLQRLDLSKYETRLKTFNSEWKVPFLTPSQMANAGFYYLGVHDRVGCIFCSKEFDSWEPRDDPLVEHKRQSPQCAFFRECTGFDVCGLYSALPTNDNDNQDEITTIQSYLSSVGILFNIDTPRLKAYASIDSRLATFRNVMWAMEKPPHEYAEAGFIYIGKGITDEMICFYCCQGLKDWEEGDDPWTEHARWSKTCGFVLLKKGKVFIDEAHGIKNNYDQRNEEELPKLIAECKNISISDKNIRINLMNKKPETVRVMPKYRAKPRSQQDPNSIPDYRLCKICYKEEMKLAFIPCGHVLACVQCTITLETCPVCRNPFNMVMEVNIAYNEKSKPSTMVKWHSSESASEAEKEEEEEEEEEEDQDPTLCNVCEEEEMEAVFIPCKHVYACGKCAADIHSCPVCSVTVRATVQVYL